jgi:hypothetical protein
MRSPTSFVAYAPLIDDEEFINLSGNMKTLTSASARLIEETKKLVLISRTLAANLIKAIDSYKLTRSNRYTKMSNFFSTIDRDVNFDDLRELLIAFHEDPTQTEVSYNPLALALWVYIYVTSSDYPVRITNKSRMRSAIYLVLEKEYSLSFLKSLSDHLDNLIFDRESFLNDLIIESVHLQSFSNSLIFKVILLSQRVELLSKLISKIANAYLPPNVIRESVVPNSNFVDQLHEHIDILNAQVSEIKDEVNGEIEEKHIPKNENDYKKKDARSKQLFANRTMRDPRAVPARKNSDSKRDDHSPTGSIELRSLKN